MNSSRVWLGSRNTKSKERRDRGTELMAGTAESNWDLLRKEKAFLTFELPQREELLFMHGGRFG
jgi:hypothetical protein